MLIKNEASMGTNPNRVENLSYTQSDLLGDEFEIDYEGLKDLNYIIEVVEQHFKHIKKESEEVVLDEDQQ